MPIVCAESAIRTVLFAPTGRLSIAAFAVPAIRSPFAVTTAVGATAAAAFAAVSAFPAMIYAFAARSYALFTANGVADLVSFVESIALESIAIPLTVVVASGGRSPLMVIQEVVAESYT